MEEKKFTLNFGNKDFVIKTGKLAKQASASCTVEYGGTVVLVTVCMSKKSKDLDFFPLTVEFQEKTYAAGRIPGGFFKREGRPSEKGILTSRLIDRPIRPLFKDGLRNEVQVVATVLSHDGENDPDMLAMLGSSIVLHISEIPWNGPIGGVRIANIDGTIVLNPTYEEIANSTMDLVVAGHRDGVVMLEAGTKELSNDEVLSAIDTGFKEIQKLIDFQESIKKEIGKEKAIVDLKVVADDVFEKIKADAVEALKKLDTMDCKEERTQLFEDLSTSLKEKYLADGNGEVTESDIANAIYKIEKKFVRSYIINKKKRTDGRGYEEIRKITCEVGLLPRTHGSGLFTRGETQSLSVVTLGTRSDEQIIDALQGESKKSFMLHYNFPPFSVGEARPMRGTGRREIGHGALAERAFSYVIPSKEDFPYTIRMVSEILESNGSSSMATVCAGTLAFMDAGVPIKRPVAGIAMGLVKDGDNAAILTDIAGIEDHFGDMDFKVTGTEDGITAIQLDVKLAEGLTLNLVKDIINQAHTARLSILKKITALISTPREDLSSFAPRIITMKIDTDKIREVIGPGGKVIKKIIEDTGVDINIEDDGTIHIASVDQSASDKAIAIIESIVEEVEVGKTYEGTVKRIMNFGAFIEVLPGKEGLCHVSELSNEYVANVEDVVKVGQQLKVKVIEIDKQGRVNLSIKQVEDTTNN